MKQYGTVFLSAVPMRALPSHKSEMVNQLLQDDGVEILDVQPEWLKVRSLYDGYEGWVSDKQLRLSNDCPPEPPMGNESDPVAVAEQYLDAPYLWGGRTIMGIDCSGLVQVVFRACGKRLPRDASQQAQCGVAVPFSELKSGDLAFFSNPEGKIIHVGIADGDGGIIHSSGYVHRATLDSTGILDIRTGTYSHHLDRIRRV